MDRSRKLSRQQQDEQISDRRGGTERIKDSALRHPDHNAIFYTWSSSYLDSAFSHGTSAIHHTAIFRASFTQP